MSRAYFPERLFGVVNCKVSRKWEHGRQLSKVVMWENLSLHRMAHKAFWKFESPHLQLAPVLLQVSPEGAILIVWLTLHRMLGRAVDDTSTGSDSEYSKCVLASSSIHIPN
jgi:hypothetical protein